VFDTCRLEKLLAFERTLDTVVWQLLASVACPGYTIHTVVELSHAILKPIEVQPSNPIRLRKGAMLIYLVNLRCSRCTPGLRTGNV
jgi:hypothetical protein